MDRVHTIADALGHTTTFAYNNRGQVLTTTFPTTPPNPPNPPNPTVTNVYNPNGTLASTTDELGHTTSYTYDDYRRLTSVTLPRPTSSTVPSPTTFSYDHNGATAADYTHTDANSTRVTSPTGK